MVNQPIWTKKSYICTILILLNFLLFLSVWRRNLVLSFKTLCNSLHHHRIVCVVLALHLPIYHLHWSYANCNSSSRTSPSHINRICRVLVFVQYIRHHRRHRHHIQRWRQRRHGVVGKYSAFTIHLYLFTCVLNKTNSIIKIQSAYMIFFFFIYNHQNLFAARCIYLYTSRHNTHSHTDIKCIWCAYACIVWRVLACLFRTMRRIRIYKCSS